jgi:RNA polymerase sigma-70 factor (ECF subfamily)
MRGRKGRAAGRRARATRAGGVAGERPTDAAAEDEEALVARARAGDPDAWETLYRRAYAPLFWYARRRLPSDGHAEEAVSETFVRAYDAIGRFRPSGRSVDAWLFGIMRNVVLEAYRLTGRVGGTPVEAQVAAAGPAAAEPLERLLADEEAGLLRAAFERLSPEDQEVLELRVIAGLDSEAVGRVLGKRPGAVRMAQARALARLRRALEEEVRT